jgi:hypothetical protein
MLVRATLGKELIGNVFATSWEFEGRMVCWITQLCVKEKWRRRGAATQVSSHVLWIKTCRQLTLSHPSFLSVPMSLLTVRQLKPLVSYKFLEGLGGLKNVIYISTSPSFDSIIVLASLFFESRWLLRVAEICRTKC